MEISDKKILFLYTGKHRCHTAMAKSVGASFLSLDHKYPWIGRGGILKQLIGEIHSILYIPQGFDCIIVEGYYPFPVIARKLGLLHRKTRIVNMSMDPSPYYMYIKKIPAVRRLLLRRFMRCVDGFLVPCEMIRSLIQSQIGEFKCVITPGFVDQKTAKALLYLKPGLTARQMICIANGPDVYYKGLDLLIDVFERVQVQLPEIKLVIIGRWQRSVIQQFMRPGIHFTGHLNLNPEGLSFLEGSSLGVHLGRGESFGVAPLEIMLAGIPCLVSEWTGMNELAHQVSEELVVPLDSKTASDRICTYFAHPFEVKQHRSNRARQVAKEYIEDVQIAEFAEKFDQLYLSI